tara:strand:- start:708 stop:1073 length:366 start_codon:yes stop_codon:yes gene_type:complete
MQSNKSAYSSFDMGCVYGCREIDDGEIDREEFVVKLSQLSPFREMVVSGNAIDFELTPPTDSELFVRTIPNLLSPSSELLPVTELVAFDVFFLSACGRLFDDFLGRPVRCAALTLQNTPAR